MELVNFLKPFIAILQKDKYHQKNRMRLLFNLTDRLVKVFIKHYSKYTVTHEGAILLSGDINKYNELFMTVEADEIIKRYESFKLLVNLHIMNVESLEQYIREHLLNINEKELIVSYLKQRSDYKSSKLDDMIKHLF